MDDTSLRITGGSGCGSPGELVRYTFAADGSVESVRGESAATMVPLERFRLPDRVTVGWRADVRSASPGKLARRRVPEDAGP